MTYGLIVWVWMSRSMMVRAGLPWGTLRMEVLDKQSRATRPSGEQGQYC